MVYDPKDVTVTWGGVKFEGFARDGYVCVEDSTSLGTKTLPTKKKTKVVSIRYCMIGAGPVGHPQEIFTRIAKFHGFDIIEAVPHPIGDCWIFKCQLYNTTIMSYLPSYIGVLED